MTEVSIIVPVYQAEQYLRQCIDSILAQTFSDFELILVDDGSTDHSGEICDTYAHMDSRVHVLRRENQGVAAARNAGIAYSSGKYLCFIDADDWIEPTMIEQCIMQMKKHDADVLRHGHWMDLYQEGVCVRSDRNRAPDFAEVLTHHQISEQMQVFWSNCSNYVWNYVFRRDAVSGIAFPEIKISEDHIFVLNVLERCEKITFLSEETYHYCMRMGSTANRWQETGLACQLEMVQTCHAFMHHFGISAEQKKQLMSNLVLDAYSYSMYLLCFPECKWSYREKLSKLREMRSKLEVDQYTPYAVTTGLSKGDRIKRYLMVHHLEHILLCAGPIFMRVVRKAG